MARWAARRQQRDHSADAIPKSGPGTDRPIPETLKKSTREILGGILGAPAHCAAHIIQPYLGGLEANLQISKNIPL